MAGTEQIGCQQLAQIDDGLLGRWHVPFRKGPDDLIGVQLVLQATIERGIFLVAREERF